MLNIYWVLKLYRLVIMSSVEQPCYTLINFRSDTDTPNEMQLKADLGKTSIHYLSDLSYKLLPIKSTRISVQSYYCRKSTDTVFDYSYFDCWHPYYFPSYLFTERGDEKMKIDALKRVIQMIANGERLPGLLMIIIRFVLPLQNHLIKKLLLIFWEIVPKTTSDGKLLQEMILVCDAYRKVRLRSFSTINCLTLNNLCALFFRIYNIRMNSFVVLRFAFFVNWKNLNY